MQITIPNKYQERYESLTTREKIIVVTALLATLWSIWDGLVYQPVVVKQKALQQQLDNLNTQIESQQRIATELENSGNNDPNADQQKKLAELKAQYSRLQEQVMLCSKKFVPPQLKSLLSSAPMGRRPKMSSFKSIINSPLMNVCKNHRYLN